MFPTYYMTTDSGQLKQRGDQRVIDLSSFPLSSKGVDEDQQPVWTQGAWGHILKWQVGEITKKSDIPLAGGRLLKDWWKLKFMLTVCFQGTSQMLHPLISEVSTRAAELDATQSP